MSYLSHLSDFPAIALSFMLLPTPPRSRSQYYPDPCLLCSGVMCIVFQNSMDSLQGISLHGQPAMGGLTTGLQVGQCHQHTTVQYHLGT